LHAPEVECIAKGKARTRYEFGVKASIAVTNARSAGGQFVLGIKAMPGLPYDGHTLKDQIAQVERLTGETVARVYVDKGYRGHGLKAPEIHITQSPGQRSPTVKRELRRRADEPPDARPLDARRSAPQAQESRPTPGAPPALAPEHGQE
jgi:transposase, IS5 family